MGWKIFIIILILFAGCISQKTVSTTDADGDGYASDLDCKDNDSKIHPGAQEICNDAKDNDCNGKTDCSDTACADNPACTQAEKTPVFLPGTQPGKVKLNSAEENCRICHGDYATYAHYDTWRGTLMAEALNDPLALALIAAENKIFNGIVGDYCFRCHTPKGWLEGRSEPVSGGLLRGADFESVTCDICHRLVDPFSKEGTALVEPDVDIIGNCQFVVDPDKTMQRGPFNDSSAPTHGTMYSKFVTSSDLCGVCHEINNPLYSPPFPLEKTYSEWKYSAFSKEGIECQACHMDRESGYASSSDFYAKGRNRSRISLHIFQGGNAWMPDVLPLIHEYDNGTLTKLNRIKMEAIEILKNAASLTASVESGKLAVKVTNLGGHKLPTGYTEGRRMWINVRFLDASGNVLKESGKYDSNTGVLTNDGELKVYESKPGMKGIKGYPDGPSLHFAINNYIYKDNRIPPRGFTNAEYEKAGALIRGASYADGQYWDITEYITPENAVKADIALYYQTTSKEFVEFLRDANINNTWDVFNAGKNIYELWEKTGKAAPVEMAKINIAIK